METFVGTIELFAFGFAPRGWKLCDGTSLPVNSFPVLYSLIGVTYGGDGRSTFNIPNLLGTEPLPYMKYYIAIDGLYPTRP